jgi:acyl carrier protein
MSTLAAIQDTVRSYIIATFLRGESPTALNETTALITGGVLDSISTLEVVTYLEETFGIRLEAHEAGVDHLNTLRDIAELVAAKQSAKRP